MREPDAVVLRGATYELAEGPVWDDATDGLSFVDIAAGLVLSGRLEDDEVLVDSVLHFPMTVGAAVLATDGGMLVAAGTGIVAVAADGTRSASLPILDPAAPARLNDGTADPAGRLVVGSLATDRAIGRASLYRVDVDGATTVLRSGLSLANGLGWSPDGDRIYLADSVPGTVWTAAYDYDSGSVGDWTTLLTGFDGLPDGLCVDSEGRLWIACWGGSAVRCYSPSGELLSTLRLPVPHVTSCAFVGPHRDRLLVTTARDELDEAARLRYPLSGRLFLADVGATGLPTRRWAGSTAPPPWSGAAPDDSTTRTSSS